MKVRIEIVDDRVTCKQDATEAYSASVADFVAALVASSDQPRVAEPLPDGVRVLRQRGDAAVVVIEERPQTRTVQWLTEDSPAPYGKGATYRLARIAFPWIVVAVALRGGALTGFQQCFYRLQPLTRMEDELLLPNLYNVSVNGYGQQCWLCLANLRADLSRMTWHQRVSAIRTHFWAAWNRSSDVHEGASYFTAMRELDPRVASVQDWESATREDPLFPLKIAWKPSGQTLGSMVDDMLRRVAPAAPPTHAAHLLQSLLLAQSPGRRRGLRSLFFK